MRSLRRMAVAALAGAGAGLGQVPFGLWPLALLAFAWAVRRGLGAREGWAFGVGHFVVALHWIVEPFLVEPEVTGWMAPFGLVGLAGGLALIWGAAFGVARRLGLGPFATAAVLALAEAVRSFALTGFPWALPGHIWIGTPFEQVVALGGPQGLTLLTLLAAAWVAWIGRSPALGIGPVIGAVLWVVLDPGPAPAPDPAAPLIRIVQPNVPQAEKWDPALAPGHLDRLLDLSGGTPAALTLWPETALVWLLDEAGPILAEGAARGGGSLVTGVGRRTGEGTYANSLAVADATGAVSAVYDKAHLVPFGEYLPLPRVVDALGLSALADPIGAGFRPGPGPALLDVPGIGPMRPLICYEDIFAEEVAAPGPRPRLIAVVTNDAWFGGWAGPAQHLALGRLRAIEQGVPVARAANTGISALVDAQGRVLASRPLGTAGSIEAPLPGVIAPPVYTAWGDLPALIYAASVALAGLFARRRLDPPGVRP